MKYTAWFSTIAAVALTAVPSMGHAQLRIRCVQPAPADVNGPCILTARRDPGLEPIVVVVEQDGVPKHGISVIFSTSVGGVEDTLAVSQANGEARTVWSGSLAAPVTVTATAVLGGARHSLPIQVKAPDPARVYTLHIRSERGGDGQDWYEKRQLPEPLIVDIIGADNITCAGEVVVFRPTGGGSTSPDSVRAEWNDKTSICSARARWRLGEGVGDQHLRAQLAGSNGANGRSAQFTATARALPRLFAGLALTATTGYRRVSTTADTVVVTRQSDDSTVTSRRVTTHRAPERVNEEWRKIQPVVGFDWPMLPRNGRLRASIAASMEHPTTDWMFGISLLQMRYGVQHESVGVSIHLIGQVSRRSVVENALACRNLEQCGTDDRVRVVGGGLMFVADSGTLLGPLTSIFGLK